MVNKKYNSWEEYVQRYADVLKKSGYIENRDKFVAWMYQKDYCNGLPMGDPLLYNICYQIDKKMNSNKDQHHMILISGTIGKGKSTLALQMSALLDPKFNMHKICYIPYHLFDNLSEIRHKEVILVDEGGNFIKGRNAMSKQNKQISQAFQLVRALQRIFIIAYDEPDKLDKDVIDKFDTILLKRYRANQSGNKKYSEYIFFDVHGSDQVKNMLKRKFTIGSPEMQPVIYKYGIAGDNFDRIPTINDVNEKIYKSEKEKHLTEFMGQLKIEFSPDKPEEKPIDDKLIDIKDAAEMLAMNKDYIRRKIKTGQLEGYKIGLKYKMSEKYIISLRNQVGGGAEINNTNGSEETT